MHLIIKLPDGGRGIVECDDHDSMEHLWTKMRGLCPSIHPQSLSLTLDGKTLNKAGSMADNNLHHESTLTVVVTHSRGEIANPLPDSIVKLNVAGTFIQTSLRTLVNTKTEHSLLHDLFKYPGATAAADGEGENDCTTISL